MAQHIGIQIIDENGECIIRPDLNLALLEKFAVSECLESGYPMLRSIDEYGLTYFNSKQNNALIKELSRLEGLEGLQDLIRQLMKLLGNLEQHQLVKIIGD